MTEREILKYLETQGVPHQFVNRSGVETLQCLDLSQVSGKYSGYFDDGGLFRAAHIEVTADETPYISSKIPVVGSVAQHQAKQDAADNEEAEFLAEAQRQAAVELEGVSS